ncbi:MAG: sigma-54-dependent Fis family transcriptional regulator [Candidatus Hydrogenedentes bacterium]|nr:sigma-54-dependent Fis family transcriptional regulator [Candidatus Hydrogenedentota bacterium]
MPVPLQSRNRIEPAAVLVATSDVAYGATLNDFLKHAALSVERVHDVQGVLRLAGRRTFDCIVLDLALGGPGGLDLVSFIRENASGAPLILLFDIAQIERALEGVRNGAFFYLPDTSPPSDVALVVEKALHYHATSIRLEAYEKSVFEELVGHSPAMQRVVATIQKVAPTDSTVLLLGESGTGKEVLANTIHRLSNRQDRPFIAINCAALPENLLESEMFGHVKGAFTGADRDKVGLFEEANGGTIFLDEIGDMSPITQAKLLRVLQSGEIRRVGASLSQRVNVRVLAATNVDLVEAVADHRFREDLYFRLNVIQIRIPPLRERMEALPALTRHFLARHSQHFGKPVHGLDDHAYSLLTHYEFPGNVRELESILAHAVIMAEGDLIRAADLPEQVRVGLRPRLSLPYHAEDGILPLNAVEANHIRTVLERLEWNQSHAAQRLGISRSTLWRKMKEYGIEREG